MNPVWIVVAVVVVGLVLLGTYFEHRRITWAKVAGALGLRHEPPRTVATDVTHETIQGVIRDCAVSVTIELYVREDHAGPVKIIHRQEHQEIIITGADMPDMPSALAGALVWPRGAGWSYSAPAWKLRTAPSPASGAALIEQGVALAEALRSIRDVPETLQALIRKPAAAPYFEVALRVLLADARQHAGVHAAAQADTTGDLAMMLARLTDDLGVLRDLVKKGSPCMQAAFDILVNEHPAAPETREALVAQLAWRDRMTSKEIEQLVAAVRRTRLPEGEEVLLGLVDHKDQEVRLLVIEALRDTGTSRALGALEAIVQRGDKLRARLATTAIGEIKSRERISA